MTFQPRFYYMLAVSCIGVLFGILWSVCPMFVDDLDYMSGWTKSFCEAPSFDIPWQSLADQLKYRLSYDNLRLANLFFLLLCCLPKWLLGMSTGFVTAFCIVLINKIAGFGNTFYGACLSAAYAYFLLLGQHLLLSVDFAFNYIWGSAFFLLSWYLFSDRNKGYSIYVYGIIGFITGCWHEGIALSLLGGFCLVGLYRFSKEGRFFNREQLVIVLSLLVGIILLFCVPGVWNRLSVFNEDAELNSRTLYEILNILAHCFLPLLLPLLLLSVSVLKKIEITNKAIEVILIVSGVWLVNIGIGIAIDFSAYPRQFFSDIVAGTVLMLMAAGLLTSCFIKVRSFVRVLTIAMTLLMFSSVVVGIVGINRMRPNYEYAVNSQFENPENAVFLEVKLPHNNHFSRYVPSLEWIYWDRWANMCVNSYNYPCDNDVRMKVVSKELENFSECESEKDETTDILYYKDLFVIELPDYISNIAPKRLKLRMYDNDSGEHDTEGVAVPFFSKTDGRWYAQIIPFRHDNSIFSIPRSYSRVKEWSVS